MRILVASVRIKKESPEIDGVFDQQLQWLRRALSQAKSVAKHLKRETAPIHGEALHPWTDARVRRVHTFNRVFDLSIFFYEQPHRKCGIECTVIVFPCAHHLRTGFV